MGRHTELSVAPQKYTWACKDCCVSVCRPLPLRQQITLYCTVLCSVSTLTCCTLLHSTLLYCVFFPTLLNYVEFCQASPLSQVQLCHPSSVASPSAPNICFLTANQSVFSMCDLPTNTHTPIHTRSQIVKEFIGFKSTILAKSACLSVFLIKMKVKLISWSGLARQFSVTPSQLVVQSWFCGEAFFQASPSRPGLRAKPAVGG